MLGICVINSNPIHLVRDQPELSPGCHLGYYLWHLGGSQFGPNNPHKLTHSQHRQHPAQCCVWNTDVSQTTEEFQ